MNFLWLMLACQPKAVAPEGPLATIPQVPAPQASWYTVQTDTPKDFLVAQMARDFSWSEALSGAAAEVALKVVDRPIRLQDAQWAAVRAGYPFTVSNVIVGDVEIDQFPKDLRGLLLKQKHNHLGIVRVRKGTLDRWVVLVAQQGNLTNDFPREVELDEEVTVEGRGTFRLLTPEGTVSSGALPLTKRFSQPGEWWLELDSSPSVSIPLYVDEGTPVHPLFVTEDVGLEIEEPDRMEEDAFILLEEMRERKGMVSVFEESQLLTSFADSALKEVLSGNWNHEANIDLLRKVGFVGGPVYQVICEGSTVYACLDGLSWTLNGRQAFLDPDIRSIGMALHVQTNGVVMVINLSSI